MGKYSLVEHGMVILYYNIEGKYRIDREFILYVIFIVLIYLKYYQ